MAKQLTDPGILRKIPLFSSLSDGELMAIINSPENSVVHFEAKKTIVREAETGDCMYIILDGTAEVSIRGGAANREITIAKLKQGDFFGEQALTVEDETGRRNATVRSFNPCTVFKISRKHVHVAIHRDKTGDKPRQLKHDPEVMSSPQAIKIRAIISGMRLFKSLTKEELASITTWTEVIEVEPGEFVLKESERAEAMYIVLDGTVEIFTMDDNGKIVLLSSLTRGNYFGEQALLPGSSGIRSAYARSHDRAKLIKIPKAYFRLVLNRDAALVRALQQIADGHSRQLEQIQKGN